MTNVSDELKRNRYLNEAIGRRICMTVCIAAICDRSLGSSPKIVFCAEREVTAGIEFESGEPKFRSITPYCYALESSEDSQLSDLVLDRIEGIIKKTPNKQYTIMDIAKIFSQECIKFRKETINREVISDYNLVKEGLDENAHSLTELTVKAVENYKYPEFGFMVVGLEMFSKPNKLGMTNEAHIYVVNQNGEIRPHDTSGFATMGGGGTLAFLELTKYPYSRASSLIAAVPRVYFAKKISQRVGGVGNFTDMFVLYFEKKEDGTYVPALYPFSSKEYVDKLDAAIENIKKYEIQTFNGVMKDIYDLLQGQGKEKEKGTI